MRTTFLIAVPVVLSLWSAEGAAGQATSSAQTGTTAVTFRLHIVGRPARGTTFWVAYGPLGGRFGIIRLSPSEPGVYTATRRLPAHGAGIFAYLAGQGVIHTRLGPAPGDPVVTIRRVGPLSVSRVASLQVRWRVPVG